jgi:hypothetical protein
MSIQPPFYLERGPAPTGVCSRWLGDSPCGAAGTHHVIWEPADLTNGCVCPVHVAEIRREWVYIGLHPYTADCVAFTTGDAMWILSEDRCARDPGTVTGFVDVRAAARL